MSENAQKADTAVAALALIAEAIDQYPPKDLWEANYLLDRLNGLASGVLVDIGAVKLAS